MFKTVITLAVLTTAATAFCQDATPPLPSDRDAAEANLRRIFERSKSSENEDVRKEIEAERQKALEEILKKYPVEPKPASRVVPEHDEKLSTSGAKESTQPTAELKTKINPPTQPQADSKVVAVDSGQQPASKRKTSNIPIRDAAIKTASHIEDTKADGVMGRLNDMHALLIELVEMAKRIEKRLDAIESKAK